MVLMEMAAVGVLWKAYQNRKDPAPAAAERPAASSISLSLGGDPPPPDPPACTTSFFCRQAQQDFDFDEEAPPSADAVREQLQEMHERGKDENDGDEEEEEIFGSGLLGVDWHGMRFEEEDINCASLYEELVKPRTLFPIIHPYFLAETNKWVYVLEKWQDGVTVSRFRDKEKAIRSRGKWFGQGRQAKRRMPKLVQSTSDVNLCIGELLVWSMHHPHFKQYSDNCHTFAANLCKKCNMMSPNYKIEELLYEDY